MSILGSLVKPQSGKAVSTITTRSMTVCAQTVGRPRKQHHQKSSNQKSHDRVRPHQIDYSCIEQFFINSLVAASSCQQHRHGGYARQANAAKFTSRDTRHAWASTSTRRHFSSLPRRREGSESIRATRSAKHTSREAENGSAPNEHEHGGGNNPNGEKSGPPDITKEEYEELVNTYPGFQGKRRAADSRSNPNGGGNQHYRLAPRLVLSLEEEAEAEKQGQSSRTREIDDATQETIDHLVKLVRKPLGRTNLSKLWGLYESLPSPRPACLSQRAIYRIFRHLAWVEFKSGPGAMERYMTFLDECLADNIPLTEGIWNTAISFSARWVRRVSSDEVKAAVETWMRMEHFGFAASHVTFNILFDAAVRAERFALADTIYSELVTRKMPMNRYLRTSVIYYAGKQGSGDAVRSAFRDLVNAGELVDTAVMNCVMLSLIRAGEGPAAENVFARMKLLHEQKFGTIGPQTWQAQKELGRFLDKTAEQLRRERDKFKQSFFGTAFSNEDKKEAVQRATPLAPNARSYRILIAHHSRTTGELNRIRELIAEMRDAELHVHGSVYYFFFRGFAQHGGFARATWSRSALEDVWAECLEAMASDNLDDQTQAERDARAKKKEPSDDGWTPDPAAEAIFDEESDDDYYGLAEDERAPYFTSALAHIVIKAFYKCAGIARMQEVHNQILLLWTDISPDQREDMQSLVDRCLREQGKYV